MPQVGKEGQQPESSKPIVSTPWQLSNCPRSPPSSHHLPASVSCSATHVHTCVCVHAPVCQTDAAVNALLSPQLLPKIIVSPGRLIPVSGCDCLPLAPPIPRANTADASECAGHHHLSAASADLPTVNGHWGDFWKAEDTPEPHHAQDLCICRFHADVGDQTRTSEKHSK